MAINLVTVTGNLATLLGINPYRGAVWFRLDKIDWTGDGYVFAPDYTIVESQPDGSFSVGLQSTDDLLNDTVYSVVLKYFDRGAKKEVDYPIGRFALPMGGPYLLTDLLTAGTIAPVPADILALALSYKVAAEAAAVQTGLDAVATAADVIASAASAAAAEAALDGTIAAAASIGMYADTTLAAALVTGLAAAAEGDTFHATGADVDYVGVYKDVSGVAVEQVRYPTADAVNAVTRLVQAGPETTGAEIIYETGIDEEAGVYRRVTSLRTTDQVHEVRSSATQTMIGDEEAGVTFMATDTQVTIGPLQFRHTQRTGVFVVVDDGEGGAILGNMSDPGPDPTAGGSVLDDGVFFPGPIVGVEGRDLILHVPSMLADRTRASEVIAAVVAGFSTGTVSGDNVLRIDPATLGAFANISIRDKASSTTRYRRFADVVALDPVQSPTVALNVLSIGDSIWNRQGASISNEQLTDLGFVPTWVGTINGSASSADPDLANGPLGEGREGWETGDFTYAITDRVTVITPGNEASYLAASKATKWPQNPFLRAATGGDDPAIIRNGMVFDVAYYLSRFSLATPDVVIYSVGTNDVRDLAESVVYDTVYDNDLLVMGQIRAALPSVKILRTLPGTAMDPARDPLWTAEYTEVIRAILDAQTTLADPDLIVVPTWALVDHEAGYAFASATPDATTGFANVAFSDAIHPTGATRHGLYQSLAAYIGAAKLNLI